MKNKGPILVTGSSSGIGLAVCQALLAADYTVIGIARRQAAIPNKNYTHVQLDLADTQALTKQLPKLAKEYSPITGLIACAGIGRFGSIEEFSYQQIEQVINLNLLSQIHLSRALLPQLKRQQQADLIYIGSESALRGAKRGAIYCASKFGLRGFTQALRQDCAGSNVRVTLINPGMVNTAFFEKLNFQPGKDDSNAITADDVANAVLMTLKMRPGTVVDEINLTPQRKVIEFSKE